MSTQLVQVAVLEKWYGIDYVLFGDKKPESILGEKFEQYLTAKAALLHNLFEIFNKVSFQTDRTFKLVSEMKEYASHCAYLAKTSAKTVLEESATIEDIKQEIQETVELMNITNEDATKLITAKRFVATAIDSLALTEALSGKNACLPCLNDWEGKVMIDAHKTLRDKLIDITI